MLKVCFATLICSSAVLLGGCQKSAADGSSAGARGPQQPSATQTVPGTQAGGAGNTSVPAAETAVAPSAIKPADTASAGRTNTEMSRAQESSAMPMPGQVNDHSAPLVTDKSALPARRASAP